jgi:hypothetical protein
MYQHTLWAASQKKYFTRLVILVKEQHFAPITTILQKEQDENSLRKLNGMRGRYSHSIKHAVEMHGRISHIITMDDNYRARSTQHAKNYATKLTTFGVIANDFYILNYSRTQIIAKFRSLLCPVPSSWARERTPNDTEIKSNCREKHQNVI